MIQQSTGLKRNKNNKILEKFYTNKQTVNGCITQFNLVMKDYNFSKENDVIIEPSAGNGAFIEGCNRICNNCLFYDIEPEHNDIVKQDYLAFDYSNIQQKYNNIHIIGNPPFGRQSSLAIKFIRYSALFCNSIKRFSSRMDSRSRLSNLSVAICATDFTCSDFVDSLFE